MKLILSEEIKWKRARTHVFVEIQDGSHLLEQQQRLAPEQNTPSITYKERERERCFFQWCSFRTKRLSDREGSEHARLHLATTLESHERFNCCLKRSLVKSHVLITLMTGEQRYTLMIHVAASQTASWMIDRSYFPVTVTSNYSVTLCCN